jgi:DNA-binding XRE family transcriptional regulator
MGKMLSIREARKRAGMIQADLGRLVDIPQVLVSFVENEVVTVPKRDRPTWEWALNSPGQIQWPDE